MTYVTLSRAEPIATRASVGIGTIWAMWCRMASGSAGWLVLLTLFGGLELADIVTTNIGLGVPGNWEANPLMAMAQTHLGTLWWLPKLAVVAFVCVAAPFTRRRWFMILAVAYCTLTVSGNLLAL